MPNGGFAVMACRDGRGWQCDPLPTAVLSDLEHCIAALRQQPGDILGSLAMLDVEDEFFVLVRLMPDQSVRLLLSDGTAAQEWDLAEQAAEFLDEPDLDGGTEVLPMGDLDLLADLGLPAPELRLIVDDLDLYADEMLGIIAGRIGVAEEYARALDAAHST